jgi:hypothetical protein
MDPKSIEQNIQPISEELQTPPTETVSQETAPTTAPPEADFEIESIPEQISEKKEGSFFGEAIGEIKKKLSKKPKQQKRQAIPEVRNETTLKIEQILSQGMEKAYEELTPVQKQEFKIKGEKTALEIQNLLKSTHVKVKKIFFLITEWLKMLPGISKFFLEQEAKIKADKIIAMRKK